MPNKYKVTSLLAVRGLLVESRAGDQRLFDFKKSKIFSDFSTLKVACRKSLTTLFNYLFLDLIRHLNEHFKIMNHVTLIQTVVYFVLNCFFILAKGQLILIIIQFFFLIHIGKQWNARETTMVSEEPAQHE